MTFDFLARLAAASLNLAASKSIECLSLRMIYAIVSVTVNSQVWSILYGMRRGLGAAYSLPYQMGRSRPLHCLHRLNVAWFTEAFSILRRPVDCAYSLFRTLPVRRSP